METGVSAKRKMFVVHEAPVEDVGKRIVRIQPGDMAELDITVADIVEVRGSNTTVARVLPITNPYLEMRAVQLDGTTREAFGQADKLRTTFLAPPQITSLAQALPEFFPDTVLSVGEMVDRTLAVLQKRGKGVRPS